MNREDGGTGRLALGLVLAVLLTVGGGMVLSRWADEGAAPETVGATGPPAGRDAGTTTLPPDPPATTTAPPAEVPSPTSTAARPSTTRAATTPTTPTSSGSVAGPQPGPTTTTAPEADVAAGDGPPGPACVSTMFDTRLTLDRPTYRPGETVRGTATFTNVSGNTCYWASTTGAVEVLDGGGRATAPKAIVIRDGFHWIPFTPGEVFALNPTWDQQACPPDGLPMPCAQAPPGGYTMVVTEQPYGVARATFQLVSG